MTPTADPLFETPAAAAVFSSALARTTGGWTIAYRAQTASTNDLALADARAGARHGQTHVTDEQTVGRGQRGRTWDSPPNLSLLFSAVIRGPGLTPERTGWLALCGGLACVEALRAETGAEVRLKWPNDLVVLGQPEAHPPWRKVGGILVESRMTGHLCVDYAVVGIGVNVNQEAGELPADARTPALSLRLASGRAFDRRVLLSRLLQRLAERVAWVHRGGDFASMTSDVDTAFKGWWTGWELRVRTPLGERRGQLVALDAHGRFQLGNRRGRCETFSDAEWLDGDRAPEPLKDADATGDSA